MKTNLFQRHANTVIASASSKTKKIIILPDVLKSFIMIRLLTLLAIFVGTSMIVLGQTPPAEYISISKSGPSVAIPGDLITYTISVGNGSKTNWTGTITDDLPAEFTYQSTNTTPVSISGQKLTWSSLTIPAGQNRIITVTGYAGKLGSTFNPQRNPSSYYMQNSNVTTPITNSVTLNHGTGSLPAILSDTYTSNIKQTCNFSFAGVDGQIKMSTGATFTYLVVIQNLGNVYDRFTLYTDPNNNEYASCNNPDGSTSTRNERLNNQILDMSGVALTQTPWIAPGEPYTFYLKLTTPAGTSSQRWNCTDLRVTSALCGQVQTQTFHTATINPSNEPNLYIHQVDFPDPVECGDFVNYSIFITNLGNKASFNTVITDTYDPFIQYVSSTPAPDAGTNNRWTLGQIPVGGYAKVDIKASIKSGVYNGQQLVNNVVVNYDDGAATPTHFTNNASGTVTVNAFPDMVLTKSASPTTLKLGETITYTLTYSNTGCGIGTGVKIVDDYDEVHTQIVDAGGGVASGGKITWDAGNISPASGTHTLTYKVKVTNVACGSVQIQNDAIISSFEPDGNILNNSAAISVLAISAPNWTIFPLDVTVNCNNIPSVAQIGSDKDVWALDACGRNVTITYLTPEVRTNGICADKYTLTRTWRAVDTDGNFSERSQVITVADNTPPSITCPSFSGYNITDDGLGNITVRLEANSGSNYLVSVNDFNPSVSDICDNSPGLTYTLTGSTIGSGSNLNGITLNKGMTTVVWTATDRCGNHSSCLYTVIVNSDPGLSISKNLVNINNNPSITEFASVGDVLNYSLVVTNSGNVVLNNLLVSDPSSVVTGGSIGTLAPGASISITARHTVVQNDLDAGYFRNVATVSGETSGHVPVEAINSATVIAHQTGALTIDKTSTTVPNNFDQVGDVITFNLLITNTGNVTLTNLVVTDSRAIISGTPVTSLAPGASTTMTASYTITQADLDAGKVVNTASVRGTYTDAVKTPYSVSASDNATVPATQTGQVTLDKISTTIPDSYDHVGTILTYRITVTNTGNVTLNNLIVTDRGTNLPGSPLGYLAPSTTVSFTVTHVVTQADLDAGKVDNTASVTGVYNDANGNSQTVTDSDIATITAVQVGEITLTKTSITNPNTYNRVGDILTYNILLTNTGNVTLTVLVVSDPRASITGSPVASLAPDASITLTARHTVTQADIDAGKVDNTATVSSTYYDGNHVAHDVVASGSATITATQTGAVTLNKVSTTNPNTFDQVGDILTYNLVITNTGNVTLTNLVVTDPLATVTGSPVPSVAPGASVNLTASHTVTQSDLNAGKVDNSASVTGTYNDASGTPHYAVANDIETILAGQTGQVSIAKTSTTNPNTYRQVGDILTYNLVVSNRGNVTLTNIVVTDPQATVTGSPVASLAPGGSVTLTARHVATQADLDAGRFVNTATVHAAYTDYQNISHDASSSDAETITATLSPAMNITSSASLLTYSAVGESVTFTLVVTNTGNVTLNSVTVRDDLTAEQWPIASLAPGESRSFTTTYLIKQADLDAGNLINSASANALDLNNQPVTASVTETITATQRFLVTLTKSSSPQNHIAVNDRITYTILLRSSSNVNLTNVLVTDVLPAHTAFVSSNNGGSYNSISKTVSWNVSRIGPGETITLQFVAAVDANTEHNTVIANTAHASSSQLPNTASNTVEITAVRFPLLQTVSVTNVDCYGNSTGGATVEVVGGMPPYTFTWNSSPVQSGPVLRNVAAGTYTVKVTDALTYTDEMAVTISQPAEALSGNTIVNNVICHGESTGSIHLEVKGGTEPYSFMWSNNATSQNISDLPAGTYTVTVTDANRCSLRLEDEIQEPSEAIKISNIEIKNVECIDDPFGSITFEISGGVSPYSYLWNNGATSMHLDNISGGDYELTVTDNLGCQLNQHFYVEYKYSDCEIRVPSGLTPNGQFDNILIIRGLDKYPDNRLRIYNRYGSLVFEASPYQNNWDGVPNVGNNITEGDGRVPGGTYFYLLETKVGSDPMSGYIYLIKN